MIVEGQVHGGIAQGVGQALYEGTVYDKEGQLVTGSYMDYAMPRADYLPSFKVDTTETKCPSNPLGIKGCGEAGAIAAPAAVMNAITDALGTEDIAMPATPATVWARIAETTRPARRRNDLRRARCTISHSTARPACARPRNLLGKLEEAKLLAGGQTLIPTMKLRLASPNNIIDLNAIEGTVRHRAEGPLDRDRRDDAACRCRELGGREGESSRRLRILPASIGDPAVRHRGTIGGSVANNDPNADYPAACARRSARPSSPPSASIAADDFFKGLFETALEPDEIITKVSFPIAKKAGYEKFRNQASRFALVGVFVSKRGSEIRVAVTGAGSNGVFRVPIVRGGAEEALRAEVARRPDHPGRRHEQRHPRQRRIPRASGRRDGAPRGRAGERGPGGGRRIDRLVAKRREDAYLRHARPCAGHLA